MFRNTFAYPWLIPILCVSGCLIASMYWVFQKPLRVFLPGADKFFNQHKPIPRLNYLRIYAIIPLLITSIAAARPVTFETQIEKKANIRELMFLVDISGSMIKILPEIIREIDTLSQGFDQERVGLAVFAGTTHIIAPLSADQYFLRQRLTSLVDQRSWLVSEKEGGTAIGEALFHTQERFAGIEDDQEHRRSIVIISDGENNGGRSPKEVLPDLEDKEIRLYTVDVSDEKAADELLQLSEDSGGEYFSSISVAIDKLADIVRAQAAAEITVVNPPIRHDKSNIWRVLLIISVLPYCAGIVFSKKRRVQL